MSISRRVPATIGRWSRYRSPRAWRRRRRAISGPVSRSRCACIARLLAEDTGICLSTPASIADGADDQLPLESFSEDDEGLSPKQRDAIRLAATELQHLAARFAAEFAQMDADTVSLDAFLELRARVGVLFVEVNNASAEITKQFGIGSAQQRMIEYLRARVGEEVPAAALGGVSCIWEWARRTRELDVEQGFEIKVGAKDGIANDCYMLAADDADGERAELWRLRNRIRQLPGSAQGRMLELLRARFPNAVYRDDLDYVAKIRSRDRRKRDLEEMGWRISSWEIDPLLEHGWYRLDSLDIGPPRARESLKLREGILRAADFTCGRCGYQRAKGGESRQLQVHHRRFLREGGNDDLDNLMVVCRPCHAGIHSLDQTSVDDELLNPGADPFLAAT